MYFWGPGRAPDTCIKATSGPTLHDQDAGFGLFGDLEYEGDAECRQHNNSCRPLMETRETVRHSLKAR